MSINFLKKIKDLISFFIYIFEDVTMLLLEKIIYLNYIEKIDLEDIFF